MSAYYKCEIEENGYKEAIAEPVKMPYYAYIGFIFVIIVFFIIFTLFLIKFDKIDILYFLPADSILKKSYFYFVMFGVSALALIIFSIIKVAKNDGTHFSSIFFSMFLLVFIFTLIYSIVNIVKII